MSEDLITLYVYEIINSAEGIGIYTGPVTQSRLAELPKHYSTFKPAAEMIGDECDVYFDGHGWTTGPKLSSITPEMIASALKMKYAKRYSFDMSELREVQKINTPVDEEIFEYVGRAAAKCLDGDQTLFRIILAAEKDATAGLDDAKQLDSDFVEARAKSVLTKYRYTQIRKASIIGIYRHACNQAIEVAKTIKIVKELLHGHS